MVNNYHCPDLSSIRKASQILSGETVLSQLIKKMMHIVIENAGAEKGFLLLPRQYNWFIEAQVHISGSDATVLQSVPLEETDQIPASIIYYTACTRKSLVFDDINQEGIFVCSPTKSVLCMPLINLGQLIGILYLVNNLMAGAFTLERTELLNLLSSQIAITIKNHSLSS